MIGFPKVVGNTAEMRIVWGEVAVPVTIDVGDFSARFVADNRRRINGERMTMANYILAQKMTASYADALGWVEDSLRTAETFGALSLKARLLAEMGRKADAITTAEKAIQVGKAATPAANTTGLENQLKTWKGTN